MAMEQVQLIKDTHSKPITAVGYNPIKHEILAGFEGVWLSICCYFFKQKHNNPSLFEMLIFILVKL